MRVDGIEMFRKQLDAAKAGDNVGLLMRSLERSEVGKGDVLTIGVAPPAPGVAPDWPGGLPPG